MVETRKSTQGFGTFGGVFTPCTLTILGVIMFLRFGAVVGQGGIFHALLIVLAAKVITTLTTLSLSAIATNTRVRAGGAYFLISRSLGVEFGGAIGIVFFLAQAISVSMYVVGFAEAYVAAFPGAWDPKIVATVTNVGVFVCVFIGAGWTIKLQYAILGLLVASLVSFYAGAIPEMSIETLQANLSPGYVDTENFFTMFALFFPAVTGIMAGANMSGELKNPQKSIPVGTMWAIGVSLVIYLALAYWIARSATPEELVSNYNIMIDRAYWGPAVLAGVLGATFSSALASMVGSSRILQAMGEHRVLPGGSWLAHRTGAGEPRNAMMITGAMVFTAMLLRDLNAIAPLVTMFFLITYVMLNVVVLIEQSLGLISFRPLFRVPGYIPWIGLIGSAFAMFIINPTVSLISVSVVLAFYGVLSRRHLETPFEDVRSGLFVSFAEWAAKRAAMLPTHQERAWKPNLLVPLDDPHTVRGAFSFLQNITYPKGSVKLVGVGTEKDDKPLTQPLIELTQAFQERGVFASWTVIRTDRFADGLIFGVQALRGAFFRPNILFLHLADRNGRVDDFRDIILKTERMQLGLLLFAPHAKAGFGQRQTINVWIRDRSPDWNIEWDVGNLDLSILIAYKLKRNWNAKLRLITVVQSADAEAQAKKFMVRLMDLARLPDTNVVVEIGRFGEYVARAPQGDLNIFGLLPDPDFDFIERMVDETRSSCLFVRDSGLENVMA